jgi:hypothetical protein
VVVLLHFAERGLGVRPNSARQKHRLPRQVVLALLGNVIPRLNKALDIPKREIKTFNLK